MNNVNDPNWLGFPPGTVRLEKPEEGDVRKMPDGTFQITMRLTRAMTPEERAEQVRAKLIEYCDNCRPSSYAPWRPFEFAEMDGLIAAAIRAAVAESIQEQLRSMTDEERLEVLRGYGEWCQSCGGPAPCNCWNDE